MLIYNQKDTAERVRQLRMKRGWSQEQAAQRLGLTGGSLSRMERGCEDFRWSFWRVLGRFMG